MALLDETSIVLYGNRNVVVGLATFLDMIAMKLQHEEWQVSQEQEKKYKCDTIWQMMMIMLSNHQQKTGRGGGYSGTVSKTRWTEDSWWCRGVLINFLYSSNSRLADYGHCSNHCKMTTRKTYLIQGGWGYASTSLLSFHLMTPKLIVSHPSLWISWSKYSWFSDTK